MRLRPLFSRQLLFGLFSVLRGHPHSLAHGSLYLQGIDGISKEYMKGEYPKEWRILGRILNSTYHVKSVFPFPLYREETEAEREICMCW